jgi:hypothetical protein
MAGESKNPQMVSTALDGLHKLLAYKWIRGSFHDEEDPEHRKLIDKVIIIVTKCYETPGDDVMLQLLKGKIILYARFPVSREISSTFVVAWQELI